MNKQNVIDNNNQKADTISKRRINKKAKDVEGRINETFNKTTNVILQDFNPTQTT